jgi:hypothetical protein
LAVPQLVSFEKIRPPSPEEVLAVLAVSEEAASEKIRASTETNQQTVDVGYFFGNSDLVRRPEDDKNLNAVGGGTAKTAKTPVSAVLAVGGYARLKNCSVMAIRKTRMRLLPQKLKRAPVEVLPKLTKPPKHSREENTTLTEKIKTGSGEALPKLTNPPPAADATRWRRMFADKTIVVERARDLPQAEVQREAYNAVLTEYLNETHPNTDPNRCAHCGKLEMPDETLQPIGWGDRHAWLHRDCWEAWREARRTAAIAELAAMKIEAT